VRVIFQLISKENKTGFVVLPADNGMNKVFFLFFPDLCFPANELQNGQKKQNKELKSWVIPETQYTKPSAKVRVESNTAKLRSGSHHGLFR
jgi:hypothetical protein